MIVSVLFFVIYFGIFIFMLFQIFRTHRSKPAEPLKETPKVSILIAARNEEHTILNCLESITRLTYDQNKLEVLIGNDNSTDGTAAVVAGFIKYKPNFRLIDITQNLGQAKGKANVLAHLTKAATTGYFFITDADIELPPVWIETMLIQLKPETAIVTGITAVTGSGNFNTMQRLDWIYSLGLIQVVSDLGVPVTTMGNNMLVTRKGYESTGGYENIEFSITEDVKLFKEVLRRGWKFKNVFQKEVLALTGPQLNLGALLHQRKRWMNGLGQLPFIMKAILIIYASFYFVLIPFFWDAALWVGILILFIKWGCQSIFLKQCLHKINLKTNLKELIYFEFYQVILTMLMIIFYFLPIPVNWKDRTY